MPTGRKGHQRKLGRACSYGKSGGTRQESPAEQDTGEEPGVWQKNKGQAKVLWNKKAVILAQPPLKLTIDQISASHPTISLICHNNLRKQL